MSCLFCNIHTYRSSNSDFQILVLPEGRQWSYAPDLLYKHPVEQTDSFILYVKSAILLSRVKTFNLRFRWRMYNPGESSVLSPQNAAFDPGFFEEATSSAEFHQLDQIVTNFRPSFPPRLRSPVENEVLDPYLYTACTAAHLYVNSLDVFVYSTLMMVAELTFCCMNPMRSLTGRAARLHKRPSWRRAPSSSSCTPSELRITTSLCWIYKSLYVLSLLHWRAKV